MKMSEKWKRFWNLTARHDGFTLVELIVVIAILAILAGVAIPAYSGYIEKANTSADEALLYEINLAFQSACAANGVAPTGIKLAKWGKDAQDKQTVIEVDGKSDHQIVEDFNDFFDVANVSFKTFDAPVFVAGEFMSPYDDRLANYHDLFKAWSESPYLSAIGVDGLLGQVGSASQLAISLMSGSYAEKYTNALSGDAYAENLAKAAGYDSVAAMKTALSIPEDVPLGAQQIAQYIAMDSALAKSGLNITAAEYMSATDYTDPTYLAAQKYLESNMVDTTSVIANNAILTAAANTSAKSATELLETVKDGVNVTELDNLKNTGDAQTLADAAAVYVMYAAYCEKNGTEANMNDLSNLLTGLSKGGDGADVTAFQTYLNSPEAEADAEAYIQAIGAINSSTADADVAQELLVNGFADGELADLMASLLGG